jgi:hypothetical protein
MKADPILKGLDGVGKAWTRQIKAEERSSGARQYRESMYKESRVSLKDICFEHMEEAWDKASGGGRLPTVWRQVFYVMRQICDAHPMSDRPLRDTTFKNIFEEYIAEWRPGWDVLYGARGVFKEPHAAVNDTGLAMSTANVGNYLAAGTPSPKVERIRPRFPTQGARNRISAVLICEKEGFDDLLEAEQIPDRYDLALMSTKGISARAARDLARGLGVPCFTLHDLDKNGFVMAAGFPFAIDLGIRLDDVEEWELDPEDQYHKNPEQTGQTLLRLGATPEEAEFIAGGQRVELNMFTSDQLIEYVEGKLEEHGVEKVIPDDETLKKAWERAYMAERINDLIDHIYKDGAAELKVKDMRPMPDDLTDRIREELEENPAQSWDDALWVIFGLEFPDDDDEEGDL